MKISGFSVTMNRQQIEMSKEVTTRRAHLQVQGNQVTRIDKEDEYDFLTDEDRAKIELLERLLSALTGKEVKIRIPKLKGEEDTQQRPIIGFRLTLEEARERFTHEEVSFQTSFVVKDQTGRTIQGDLSFHLSRTTYEASYQKLEVGNLQDPLVISLPGKTASFLPDKFRIDVNLDGQADQVHRLKNDSGFLAYDRNGNGKIDDGSELFGPRTQDGFAELAAFDQDSNGWIDENDGIFNKLSIWFTGEEESLVAIKEQGIGAIYLGHLDTPFSYEEGKLQKSGFYLTEEGRAGLIQHIDLKI